MRNIEFKSRLLVTGYWLLGSLLLACLLASCKQEASKAEGAKGGRGGQAVPVNVAVARRESVPVRVLTIGWAKSINTVDLRAQVTGMLEEVHLTDGQAVTAPPVSAATASQPAMARPAAGRPGSQPDSPQPLFVIDPKPAQIALTSAQAQLTIALNNEQVAENTQATEEQRAKAALKLAEARKADAHAKARRQAELLAEGSASPEVAETTRTAATQADVEVENARTRLDEVKTLKLTILQRQQEVVLAEQAVANARLQLDYCRIYAPINGVAGEVQLKPGNLVKANDTLLVTINQIDPIDVYFAIPHPYLSVVGNALAAGSKLTVEASPKGETQPDSGRLQPVHGTLVFMDNMVDKSTGTIRLRARFDNGANRLWPGKPVDVALTLSFTNDAVVVPSRAVQAGRDGDKSVNYVLVVNADKVVRKQNVKVARTDDQIAVITEGLAGGERVITDGHFRATEGTKVDIKPTPGGEAATRGGDK